MDERRDDLVVLKEFDNLMMAEIAKSILDSANIYCTLYDEFMSAFYTPTAIPVRLMVRAEDVETADSILENR
jgi:hypothetical protein